jgi:hypothetical protein
MFCLNGIVLLHQGGFFHFLFLHFCHIVPDLNLYVNFEIIKA